MRLLIIRHGDPDYSIDSLTEEGWREAEALSEEMVKISKEPGGIRAFYVSPLGRARDTADVTLQKLGRTADTLEWLKEFSAEVSRPDKLNPSKTAWDWLPQDWTERPEFYHPEKWKEVSEFQAGGVGEEYDRICSLFDAFLAEYGYRRYDGEKGHYYEVTEGNNDTIVFFCHFGIESVLLSHLMNVSPMLIWHHMCAAPSSLTSVYSEERRKGIAAFRINKFGDTSHLYAAGLKPAFSARFCECFDNADERHDG